MGNPFDNPAIWATQPGNQAPPPPDSALRSLLAPVRGVAGGILGLSKDLAGGLTDVSQLVGPQALTDNLKATTSDLGRYQAATGNSNTIAPWQKGGQSWAEYLGYGAGSMAPTLVGLAAAPEVEALGIGTTLAKSAGAARVALPFAVGQNYNAADEKPGGATTADAVKALALSPVTAAINTFGPGALVGGLGSGIISKAAEKLGGGFLARAGAGAVVDAAAGAIQGGAGTALSDNAFRPDLTPQEKMANIVDATIGGAAIGGLAGGIMGGFHGNTRTLQRADPNAITPDVLGDTIDKALAASTQTPLGLPAPPISVDAGGRAVPGSDQSQLRATPVDPNMSDTDRQVAQYGIPGEPAQIESQTIIQPKDRPIPFVSKTDYEQGSPAPYGSAPTAELTSIAQIMQDHLTGKDPANFTDRDRKIAEHYQMVSDELASRPGNASVTNPDVQGSVGAVEQQSDASGGVEPNSTAASAPTPFNPRDFLAGVPGRSRAGYLEATSPEEMLQIAQSKAETSESIHHPEIVERLRDALGEKTPSPPAAPRAIDDIKTPDPAAPDSSKGGDATVDPKFQEDFKKILYGDKDTSQPAMKGELIRDIKDNLPANREAAELHVMDALGKNPSDGSTPDNPMELNAKGNLKTKADGLEGMQALARHLDLHDEQGNLTDHGVDVARKQIPENVSKDAATALGHGDEADAFHAGAKGDKDVSLSSLPDLRAYNAGKDWALDRDNTKEGAAASPIPRSASERETAASVERNTAQERGGEASHTVKSEGVPDIAKQARDENEGIDTVFGGKLDPAAIAQLKTVVSDGVKSGKIDLDKLDRLADAYKQGETPLANEPAARPRDVNRVQTRFGDTVVPDRTEIIRAHQRAAASREADAALALKPGEKQLMRSNAAKLIAQRDTLADIKQAHDDFRADRENGIDAKTAAIAMSKAHSGDVAGARAMLPENYQPKKYSFDATGTVQTGPRDRLEAQRVLSAARESLDGHVFVKYLSDLPGDIGEMAKRLSKLIPSDLQVQVMPQSEFDKAGLSGAHGAYYHDSHSLLLSDNMAHPAIALHEIAHSIIGAHIDEQTPIGKEMSRVFDQVKDLGPKGDYAFTDANEFFAEFIARKQVRDWVQKWSDEGKMSDGSEPKGNIFQRAWQSIQKALGMSQSRVEKLLNLVEAAGGNAAESTSGLYVTPKAFNAATKDTVKGVVGKLEERLNQVDVRTKARAIFLKFAGQNTVFEKMGKMFDREGGNGLDAIIKAQDMRAPLANLQARPLNEWVSRATDMRTADRKSYDALNRLAWLTADGIHPTRTWDEQSKFVRDNPRNKAALNEARDIMRSLQAKDVQDARANPDKATNRVSIYNDMSQLSQVERLRDFADRMHKMVESNPLSMGKIAGFEQHPAEELLDRSTREEFDVTGTHKFWDDKVTSMMKSIDDFSKIHRNVADHPGTDPKLVDQIKRGVGDLEQLGKDMREAQWKLRQGPNFSLGRTGDYFVDMKLRHLSDTKVVDPAALVKAAEHFKDFGKVIPLNGEADHVYFRVETQAAQDALFEATKQFGKMGYLRDEESPITKGKRGDGRIPNDIAPWLAKYEAGIDANPAYDSPDNAIREQLKKDMRNTTFDATSDNSIAKFLSPRDMVPGFETDMVASFMTRSKAASDAMVGRVVGPKVADGHGKMDMAYNEASKNNAIDAKQTSAMKDTIAEMRLRAAQQLQYTNTPVIDAIRRSTNFFSLGATVAYPIVQLTQIPMLALPKLGSVHGFINAAKALSTVSPEAFKIMRYIGGADVEISLAGLKRAGIDARTSEYIMHLVNAGQLGSASQAHNLSARASGEPGGALDTTMKYASAMGYYAETGSRLITALAHLKLQGGDIAPRDAAASGVEVLKASLFDFHLDAQGRAFGKNGMFGQMTPMMTQFMTYQSQLVQRLYLEADDAFTKGASAKDTSEARRFLMQHAAMTAMMAGTLGLPFATAFIGAYNIIKDKLDPSDAPSDIRSDYRNYVAKMFGKEAGEVISKGLSHEIGFDLNSRIGEQDIAPFSKFLADRRQFKDQFKDLESRSWGAPANIAANAINGMGQLADGNVMEGLRTMMPAAIANAVKAYQMSAHGYVDSRGNLLPIGKPGEGSELAQLIGFTPTAKSEYSDAAQAAGQRHAVLTERSKSLTDDIVSAIQSGNNDRAKAKIAEAQAFDAKNEPYAVIPRLGSAIAKKSTSEAIAMGTHTPIGIKPDDVAGRDQTSYANY